MGGGFKASADVNWWNSPHAIETYDSNGYLNTKFGTEFVLRLADEMVHRINANKTTMESNTLYIWCFIAVLGGTVCLTAGYIITHFKNKRANTEAKRQREEQFASLIDWQRRHMRDVNGAVRIQPNNNNAIRA